MTRISVAISIGDDGLSEISGPEWFAQRKLDGVRAMVEWDSTGRPSEAFTRKGKRVPAPVWLPNLPPATLVDGEVTSPTGWQGSLAQLSANEIEHWTPFDLVSEDPAADRLTRLVDWGLTPVEPMGVLEARERCLSEDWEGIVVRRVGAGYTGPTFKWKPIREIHALVAGGRIYLRLKDNLIRVGHAPTRADDGSPTDGKWLLQVEGVTSHHQVRAPRLVRREPKETSINFDQLGKVTFR